MEKGSKKHTPRKRWSQNFLNDPNIARKIAGSIQTEHPALILEIGPGKGRLTRFLLNRADLVLGIEIDPDLAQELSPELGYPENLRIIREDFQAIDLPALLKPHRRIEAVIIGNLPYHITSPILFKILDNATLFHQAVFMIQREVAQRIAAAPGSKTYGILSVFCQFYAEVEYLFTVPSHLFYPRPKVDSGVIRLSFFRPEQLPNINTALFREIVRTTFGQRRKMLRNTLSQLYPDAILKKIDMDLTRRPEELSVNEFVNLSNQLEYIQKSI